MVHRGVTGELFGLLGHRWVQVLLTADRVISLLKEDSEHPFPTHELPRALVGEVAQLAESDPAVLLRLQELVDGGKAEYKPMAASVLHLADLQWRPNRDRCSYLPSTICPPCTGRESI